MNTQHATPSGKRVNIKVVSFGAGAGFGFVITALNGREMAASGAFAFASPALDAGIAHADRMFPQAQ